MNLKSEQLKSDLSKHIDYDEKISKKSLLGILHETLGEKNCSEEKLDNKKFLAYNSPTGVKEVILFKQITYLGGDGQHPIFKKRVQLPLWFKDVYNFFKNDDNTNVRFIGIYTYQGNVIFTEFIKDTYLKKSFNNSSAHVYINDMYQAMKFGIFNKTDRNGNTIVTIRKISFKQYLNGTLKSENDKLFDIFKEFNNNYYTTNRWINSSNAITEMLKAGCNSWRQAEWAGWYLEFKFDKYLKENKYTDKIKYVGYSNKKKGDLDFDLWFNEEKFYGDLKASDITKKEAPGNDKATFIDCINRYDRFWYVIYEHETIKDSDTRYSDNFEATKFRTNLIKKIDGVCKTKEFNELSYCTKMKHSVNFKRMIIIELNRINYQSVLSDFNQGKQQSGEKRKVKVKISKNNIDNFVVFRQDF